LSLLFVLTDRDKMPNSKFWIRMHQHEPRFNCLCLLQFVDYQFFDNQALFLEPIDK